MPMIEANGERLDYRREGRGPALVLVHSLGTNAALWDGEIAAWSDRFDVIAVSARGHGRSSHHGAVTMTAIAEDLRAVLDALGIAKAHFLGISMGGLICARLHAMAPALFDRLVISGSFATLGADGAQRAQTVEERIPALGMVRYGAAYAAETLLPSTPQHHHRTLADWIAGMDMEAYLETVRSIFGEDVRACLRAMRCPVQVLVGAEDRRTPEALARQIVSLVPGAGLTVLDGAGHLANLDAPERFRAAVEHHLTAESG